MHTKVLLIPIGSVDSIGGDSPDTLDTWSHSVNVLHYKRTHSRCTFKLSNSHYWGNLGVINIYYVNTFENTGLHPEPVRGYSILPLSSTFHFG